MRPFSTQTISLSSLLLLIFLASNSYANPSTEDFLSQLKQQNKNIHRISGRFTQQKTLTVLPAPLLSSGSFHYQQESGLTWNTQAPIASTLLINADGIHINGQSQITPASNSQVITANIFLAVISGDLKQLRDYFTIEPVSTNLGNWQITLRPLSTELANYITSISIQGSTTTEQLSISEAGGDQTDISLVTNSIERTLP